MTDAGPHRGLVLSGAQVPAVQDQGPTIRLGRVLPGVAEVKALVEQRRRHVRGQLQTLPQAEWWDFLAKNDLLPFADYCDAINKRDKHLRDLAKNGSIQVGDSPALRTLLRGFNRDRHTPDLAGWESYLSDVTPVFGNLLAQIEGAQTFPEKARHNHTLVMGGTGWGKSEVLKVLVHHDAMQGRAGVLVLDPHGDLVKDLVSFPELVASGRLIYVQPDLWEGWTVGINPLDARGFTPQEQANLTEHLAAAFNELVKDLSTNMANAVKNCLRLLVTVPDATLLDLDVLLMTVKPGKGGNTPEEIRRAELLAIGQRFNDPMVGRFFRNDLDSDFYTATKNALRARLQWLLGFPRIRDMLCGRQTLDLEHALNSRKIILVNLEPLGASEARAAVGRLLLNMAAAIGFRRGGIAPTSRTPLHVVVDEASTMISPAMLRTLRELRKFGVYMTLAQQVGGSGFDADGKRELNQSTACKIYGGNDGGEVGRLLGGDARELPKVARHEFWVKWDQADPVRVQIRRDLAKRHLDLANEDWEDYQRELGGCYREAEEAPPEFFDAWEDEAETSPQQEPQPQKGKAAATPPEEDDWLPLE